jgi:hypothetical protein
MPRPFLFKRAVAAAWAFALLIAAAPVPAFPFAQEGQRNANAGQAQRRAARKAANQQAERAKSSEQFVGDEVRQRPRRAAARRQAAQEVRFIERLLRLPPEERARVMRENPRLQSLPPAQRRRIENRIQRLSQLPPRQRQQALERLRLFDQLPPEKQTHARTVYRRWQQIPGPRRAELLEEFDGIRDAEPQARQERFDSEEFQKRYSEQERGVLKDLADLLPDAAE